MKHLYTCILLLASIPVFSQTYELSPLFGQAGVMRIDTWSGSEIATAHAFTSDGRLVIAGTGYWSSVGGYRVPIVVLDTSCGVLDTSFSQDGMANIHFEQRTTCVGITTQPDGKIIGCGVNATSNGVSQHKPSVFRLNADGTPDLTFNGTGFNKSPFDGVSSGGFWNAFVAADGKITCIGASSTNINGGSPGLGAQRFMPDGTLDLSYGQNGISFLSVTGSNVYVDRDRGAGIIQPDGKVVAAAIVQTSTDPVIMMARFNVDGSPDISFGSAGLVNTGVPAYSYTTVGMEMMPDGRIMVSCTAGTYGFLMTRVYPNGDLDTNYGVNGISVVEPTADSRAFAMEVLPDGSTLQFGSMHWSNGPPCIVKRTMDGSIDISFGTNGTQVVTTLAGTNNEKFLGGIAMPSGRIIAYGEGQSNTMLIARITTDAENEGFVDLGGELTICNGDSVELNAGPGQSWAWSDGSTDQTVFISTPLFVQVTVTDANGCMDSDQVQVSFSPGPPVPVIDVFIDELSTTASGALQWFLNGNAIAGADQNMHTATVNGDYTVSATDSSGCSALSDVTTFATLGIGDLLDSQFQLFPNPAADQVTISLPLNTTVKQLEVFDATGRSSQLTSDARTGTIDISQLASGHYTLVLQLQDQQLITRQLIVQ